MYFSHRTNEFIVQAKSYKNREYTNAPWNHDENNVKDRLKDKLIPPSARDIIWLKANTFDF